MKSESDIRAVSEIARLGSFVRAAETLQMTQPALSRRLQRIEDELGVELFDRSARTVKPTVFGAAAIEHADKLLKAFGDLRHDLALLQDGKRGELRVTTTMYPAQISVTQAVADLVKLHPAIHVHLTIDDQHVAAQKLQEREVDIGVFWLPPEPDKDVAYHGLNFQRMKRRNHVFYCRTGHPLAMFPEATPAQIASYPLVGFHMGWHMTPFKPQELGNSGSIQPNDGTFVPQILVNSFASARAVVMSSDAVSWAPVCLLEDMIAEKQIVPLAFSLDRFVCGYDVAWPADRMLSPASKAFMDALSNIEAGIG